MFDRRPVPGFFQSITFGNDITVEFNEESTINFYDKSSDEAIMRFDPTDLSTLYAAYRTMVRERLEEARWRGEELIQQKGL